MKRARDTKRTRFRGKFDFESKATRFGVSRQETGVTSVSRLTRAIVSTESHFTKNLQALTGMVAMVVDAR